MTDHLIFLLLGLSAGAVFAALALALVIIYRSSGVINFATGAIAMYVTYTYAYLRQGQLLVIVPGLPTTVDVGHALGFWTATAAALAIAAVLGLLLYLLVFRPLRSAPPIARAVASVGIMVALTALITVRVGTNPIGVKTIFPTDIWTFGGVRLSADRTYFAITVLAIAVALACVFRFTPLGLATRAAAVSEKGAYLSGLSPDRIAAYNWMIGTAVAGLSGILIAPIVPLTPSAYTLFIVPALAAAILGRFTSVVAAAVAGLVIGMLQSEAQFLQTRYEALPASGLVELVPLILILLVLVVRARPLPSRGTAIAPTLGRAPRPRTILPPTTAGVAAALVGLLALDHQWRSGLITSLILGVIALSLVVVTGFAGQVSLAQLALAGAAGFILSPIAHDWGIPFPVAPLLAALVATAVGVIVGLPALRIRGLTVAVVTLALAYAIEAFWFRNSDFVSSSGLPVPAPKLFGADLGIGSGNDYPRLAFGLLCLVLLTAVAMGVALLRRSQLGAQMLAVRANERAAAAAGVAVVRVKLVAFGIGAFIAGLGGSLLAYQQSSVSFEPFAALAGLALFATVYLAGITSVSGGLLAGITGAGGIVFVAVDQWIGSATWYPVIVGMLLVLTALFNPEGVVGPAHQFLASRRSRGVRARAGSVLAAPVEEAPQQAPAIGPAAALSLRNITVRYGGVVAVNDVSFDVPEGAIVGLIGPNGAGKTTLIDAINGFTPALGEITLGEHKLDGLRPHERVRAGLGRTFQAIELYDDLTVRENVLVGLSARGPRAVKGGAADDLDPIFALLGLAEVCEFAAGDLSQGQRQLVSIARALAGRPKVLLLDEPAGGLDTTESHWLGERLRAVRNSGITILLVEHDMSLVLSLCDQIQVLNFGETLASGTPTQVRADRKVAEAYLGSTHAEEVMA